MRCICVWITKAFQKSVEMTKTRQQPINSHPYTQNLYIISLKTSTESKFVWMSSSGKYTKGSDKKTAHTLKSIENLKKRAQKTPSDVIPLFTLIMYSIFAISHLAIHKPTENSYKLNEKREKKHNSHNVFGIDASTRRVYTTWRHKKHTRVRQ